MVAGIAPLQFSSIALIQKSSFTSSNKTTSDAIFFLLINGINFFSTCFGKSKLTNNTSTFLSAYSLFIFSIETQEDEGYSLLKSSRYAHSDSYILDVASNGFSLVDSQNVQLRKEGNDWVNGKIYILKSS